MSQRCFFISGGDGSQKLQKVEVEIFSNQKCGEAYQNSSISARTFPDGIQFGQLCAGSTRGGKDACQVWYLGKKHIAITVVTYKNYTAIYTIFRVILGVLLY